MGNAADVEIVASRSWRRKVIFFLLTDEEKRERPIMVEVGILKHCHIFFFFLSKRVVCVCLQIKNKKVFANNIDQVQPRICEGHIKLKEPDEAIKYCTIIIKRSEALGLESSGEDELNAFVNRADRKSVV